MKVLVIPDVHLKNWIFDKAENVLKSGKAERAVCLMDMPDDWDMEFQIDRYRAIYDRAIAFAKDYPDTLWCYGNHDLSYPWGQLESGYSPYAERTVMEKLEELEKSLKNSSQINIVHRIVRVLFSHAGLSTEFVKSLNRKLLDADIDEVLRSVNTASQDKLWNNESPLWLRALDVRRRAFQSEKYKQVVGHTPVEKIMEQEGIIFTDVFSTDREGTQIGESAMVVIDSETGEYEVVEV